MHSIKSNYFYSRSIYQTTLLNRTQQNTSDPIFFVLFFDCFAQTYFRWICIFVLFGSVLFFPSLGLSIIYRMNPKSLKKKNEQQNEWTREEGDEEEEEKIWDTGRHVADGGALQMNYWRKPKGLNGTLLQYYYISLIV